MNEPITENDVLNYFYVGRVNIKNNIVDVMGYCEARVKLKEFPFQFGKSEGDFDCAHLLLTSLVGSPREVIGQFDCSSNNLKSLVGGPIKVTTNYICKNNFITSLDGGPVEVGNSFNCAGNDLTSYKGLPETIGGRLMCDWIEDAPILSLLKYNDIIIVSHGTVSRILQTYAGQKPLRQAIIKCQRELIDNGFEGNARL